MVMVPAGYHTHYPLVAACVAAAQPGLPILEMGSGDWSTAMLHWMCKATGRMLVTADNDLSWLERYRSLQRPYHDIVRVNDWAHFDVAPPAGHKRWGVAFVDHKPAARRAVDIERLKGIADVIIAHDVQPEWEHEYRYEPTLAKFRYRYDFKVAPPFTSAVSDVVDLGLAFRDV